MTQGTSQEEKGVPSAVFYKVCAAPFIAPYPPMNYGDLSTRIMSRWDKKNIQSCEEDQTSYFLIILLGLMAALITI